MVIGNASVWHPFWIVAVVGIRCNRACKPRVHVAYPETTNYFFAFVVKEEPLAIRGEGDLTPFVECSQHVDECVYGASRCIGRHNSDSIFRLILSEVDCASPALFHNKLRDARKHACSGAGHSGVVDVKRGHPNCVVSLKYDVTIGQDCCLRSIIEKNVLFASIEINPKERSFIRLRTP